jgi:uncharacterized Zn-binding protein involved in type VI secretion
MRTLRLISTVVLFLWLVAVSTIVFGEHNVSAATNNAYAYDETQQVTVEGNIVELRDFKCPVTGTEGSHITVKGSGDPIEVHLAPVKFLKEYEIVLHQGDSVKVVGSKIAFEGKPALLAKTVTVGSETFTFRDPKGKPIW